MIAFSITQFSRITIAALLCVFLDFLSICAQSGVHRLTEYCYSGSMPMSAISSSYALSLKDTCSIFIFAFSVDTDYQEVLIGSDETYIMDMETGTRYAARNALHGAMLNCHNAIINQKGKKLLFQIEFPRLPKSTKYISIYGIPAAGLIGGNCFDIAEIKQRHFFNHQLDAPELYASPLILYDDEKPHLRSPVSIKNTTIYNEGDITTYPIFIDAPRIYPVKPEVIQRNRYAFWCTKDTTYITHIIECKQKMNPFRIPSNITVVVYNDTLEGSGEIHPQYLRILSATPYPLNKNFIIKGTPGDFIPIVMKFPPLPVGANHVVLDMFGYSYPKEWMLPNDEEVYYNQWYIGYLRNNQQYVKPYPDNGGKIIR